MASILNNVFPPCIKYSGSTMNSYSIKSDSEYKSLNHFTMSYKVYRWFDGITDSENEFTRLYTNWKSMAGKESHFFYDNVTDEEMRKRAKSIANGYTHKLEKNNKYDKDGCKGFVCNSQGAAKFCLLCPLSTEYVNARIKLEQTVLGYALVNMDVSFIYIVFNNADLADIYYENVASHFTGSYAQYDKDVLLESPYNFNGLIAYYLICNAEDIKSGNLKPELRDIKARIVNGGGACLNILATELKNVSDLLVASSDHRKRISEQDYSCPLPTASMIDSFAHVVNDIVTVGLMTTEEEYKEAATQLINVYTYSDFYKKNNTVGKANRYIDELSGSTTKKRANLKREKPAQKKEKKNNNIAGQESALDYIASLFKDSPLSMDTPDEVSHFIGADKADIVDALKKDALNSVKSEKKDVTTDIARTDNVNISGMKNNASLNITDTTTGPTVQKDELSEQSSNNASVESDCSNDIGYEGEDKESVQQEEKKMLQTEPVKSSVQLEDNKSANEEQASTLNNVNEPSISSTSAAVHQKKLVTPSDVTDNFFSGISFPEDYIDDEYVEELSVENKETVSEQIEGAPTTNNIGSDFRLGSGFGSEAECSEQEEEPEEHNNVQEQESNPRKKETKNPSDTSNNEEKKRYSVYELSSLSLTDNFGELHTAYGLSESDSVKAVSKCENDICGTEPIAVEYAYNSELDIYGILVYTGRGDTFWYIVDASPDFGNTLWRLFRGERVKVCMNYAAIQSYLAKYRLKASNLVSLPAMYMASHPDATRAIVNDIVSNITHTAEHPLREFMLNYKRAYYELSGLLAANSKYMDTYKKMRMYDDIMAASYDISAVTDIVGSGITSNDYKTLVYAFNEKSSLKKTDRYCVLTARVDNGTIKGEQWSAILSCVFDRMCKGHLFTRYGMQILQCSFCEIMISCPAPSVYGINDIMVDVLKKSCRDVDGKIIPRITMKNELS